MNKMIGLTEKEIEEGRQLISRLESAGFKTDAAMWSYASSSDTWQLVLASPFVEKEGPREAYNFIQTVKCQSPRLSAIFLSRIVAVDANPQNAKRSSNWFYRFDRLENAYIYSTPGEIEEMESTKRLIANNVILAEGSGPTICVAGAQGLDVIGNILIHDKKFIEIIKGLLQREDEAFKRGYDTGLEAGRRRDTYPCMEGG